MFPRVKNSGKYRYLQIVENRRVNGKHQQQVIASLGRLDELSASGQLDDFTCRLARLCNEVRVVNAHREGSIQSKGIRRVGPAVVFERLWEALGIDRVLKRLLAGRKFGFDVERAVFLTVLHRLFASGSDRAAEQWRADQRIEGVGDLSLHQLYRAMGWLGEALPGDEQDGTTPFAPRCTKDLVEEALSARRQDLFSDLDVVFFDTTSIYFEGEGGETLGRYGKSKDHRPDLKQMVVGAVLDGGGRPVCCELWPGNTTDVKTLVPIVERLRARFHIGAVCVVADRGMISAKTIETLEGTTGLTYILGARMRKQKEVKTDVLSRGGRYQELHPKSDDPKAPSPLKVKEVFVGDRRYIVCHNEDQARKDATDREAIVAHLREQLKQGDKSLVGNKGYRKYIKTGPPHFEIDEDKIQAEARLDGKWVLRTNTELSAKDTALKYKQLWMVEQLFRTTKSILETRPIYHKCDETIRGHAFCSFLALALKTELYERLERKGRHYEWDHIRRDLEALQETELILNDDTTCFVRTELRGTCHDVMRAAGVAPPPTVRQ
jgi:transposase